MIGNSRPEMLELKGGVAAGKSGLPVSCRTFQHHRRTGHQISVHIGDCAVNTRGRLTHTGIGLLSLVNLGLLPTLLAQVLIRVQVMVGARH